MGRRFRRYVIEHQDKLTGDWVAFWWSGDDDLQGARKKFAEHLPQMYQDMAPLLVAVCQVRARQLIPNEVMEIKDKKYRMKIVRRR